MASFISTLAASFVILCYSIGCNNLDKARAFAEKTEKTDADIVMCYAHYYFVVDGISGEGTGTIDCINSGLCSIQAAIRNVTQ